MSKESVKRTKSPALETVEIPEPGMQEAKLKALGGSCSDDFNTVGAPLGNRNAPRLGQFTAEAIADRRAIRALLRESRDLMQTI